MTSVEERNKARIVRFYDEIINQGNVAAVDELMAPDFVHYGETLFPRIEGSAAIKAGVLGVINAYPDGRTVVEDMVAEGDTVVCLLSWRGTHQGPFMGIPPTGKVSAWRGISTYRFNAEGKIIERWANMDVMGQLQDLGVVPVIQLGGGQEG
ncbi:MAG TPA: ester cyclase [Candidatus Competibacteraceae bacterium]|nr:ester cyclase [Candidatus Competibacteraceae bacterium]MCP5134172.1 ester cyclase [Gammaproteobacteria bacterium]HPF59068.1 ester cyclase [Candidatus Competibacteraceae bacterium]HRX70657.1 ester cyclase [Candidatus Competibacteraceae bacterium]